MEKIIIGIHGLANKPGRNKLREWWLRSIEEGLVKNEQLKDLTIEFRMVYWAKLLYMHPLHNDKKYDFDPLYNDEPYLEAEQGALQEGKETMLDKIRGSVLDTVESGLEVLKKGPNPEFISKWLLTKIPRDLEFYYDKNREIFDRSEMKRKANQVLKDELANILERNKGKEIMLIAHSMGTIIAYDVLRDLGQLQNNEVHIKQFITMGSPLGLPFVKGKVEIQRRYDQKVGEVRTPSIVTGKWINFADKKDHIALDCYLKDDFDANASGVRVEDVFVKNDYVGLSGKRNHHKSYGYLRTPEVSEAIARFILN